MSIGGLRRGWRERAACRISSWAVRCYRPRLGGICGILRAFGAYLRPSC